MSIAPTECGWGSVVGCVNSECVANDFPGNPEGARCVRGLLDGNKIF